MAPTLWMATGVIDLVALVVDAVLEAFDWNLGIPARNDDFVWH
jgi:hypothetical protein